jgi:hypothetical protein
MAMVDPVGPGPLPLYDPSYPTRIRALKERTGVPATPLDQRAGYFRDAFNRDPAFEVLHFLPLYFGEATRTEVFAALERLAVTGDGIPSDVPTRARFGAAAIGAVLSSPGQRALLGEFVSVLSADWEGFFSDYRREGLPARNEIQAEAQSIWDQEFGPLIGPLLQELNLAGGTVFLSPAIGIEGRIFSGVPQNQQDNILVVSAPTVGDDARAVIFSMRIPHSPGAPPGAGSSLSDFLPFPCRSDRCPGRSPLRRLPECVPPGRKKHGDFAGNHS